MRISGRILQRAGGESFATSPVLAGPWVVTLGPDISPPHLDVKSTPERGKKVKKGDKITLVGFGTFSVSKRAARKGRNPQTGETIKIKASKTPKFKAGKTFKDAL